MKWVKLYADFHGHPKTLDLSLAAKGLWVDCLAWSAQHETDGFVPAALVRRIAGHDEGSEGRNLATQLVDAGLWDAQDDGYRFHDFESHQDAASHVRELTRDRVRRYRERHAETPVTQDVTPVTRTEGDKKETREDIELATQATGARPREDTPPSGAVVAVFDAWKEATGRNGTTKLTPKRRRCVQARLREGYPADELVSAVRGVARSPFHRGENDRHQRFDDLTLILRDGEHVEKFRDLEQGDGRPDMLDAVIAEIFAEKAK